MITTALILRSGYETIKSTSTFISPTHLPLLFAPANRCNARSHIPFVVTSESINSFGPARLVQRRSSHLEKDTNLWAYDPSSLGPELLLVLILIAPASVAIDFIYDFFLFSSIGSVWMIARCHGILASSCTTLSLSCLRHSPSRGTSRRLSVVGRRYCSPKFRLDGDYLRREKRWYCGVLGTG